MLLAAEKRFTKLDVPELRGAVADGATYVNGLSTKRKVGRVPARSGFHTY
jgi:hypothetical protein